MAKTIFDDGNPPIVRGTIVPATWLNLVMNHRHSGLDEDGSCPLDYAVDTGIVNAVTISLQPALTAYIPGVPIIFKANNTNTAASTLNINGLGAKSIYKNAATALVAGDIIAGQIVEVVYDGIAFQLINNGQSVDMSQFARSHGLPGYQCLPGGLILQWGVTSVPGNGVETAATLPLSWPNGFLQGVCSASSVPYQDAGFGIGSNTTYPLTKITLTNSSSIGTQNVRWIVIGR